MLIQEKGIANGFVIKNGYCLMHTTTKLVGSNYSDQNAMRQHFLPNFGSVLYRKLTKSVYLTFIIISFTFMAFVMLNGRPVYKIDFNNYYYTIIDGAKSNGFSDANFCHIPQLDPWDPAIRKYLTKFKPLQCKRLQVELTYLDENGHLTLNRSAQSESGYSTLNCKYRCFDKIEGTDDISLFYTGWVDLNKTGRSEVTCQFVEVTCSGSISAISVYTNLHSRIVFNESLATNLNNKRKTPYANSSKSRPLNVLLFVLDSISKSNFLRYLPKFSRILKHDFETVIMDGYTKVGDNSFPNAAAVLTGLRTHVAGYESELPDDMTEKVFDDWPLIWRNFSDRGYATFYAEDFPHFNLFQYTSNGFRRKPVDHYFRPFWLQLWNSFLHRRSTHLCYGNQAKHNLQLNYLKQFWTTYNDSVLKFGFNWLTELGHDWLGQIALGDDDFAKFFQDLKPLLKDTLLVVFSDHGHRFDAIRESVIGRIEERMPFCSLALPVKFKAEYPWIYANLRRNSKLLTTPYDLHATLVDVLANDFRDLALKSGGRGMSLFRRIPRHRMCSDAGVPEEFCICQEEFHVNTTDPKVLNASQLVVRHVNSLLRNFRKVCAQLSLRDIRNAQSFLPNSNAVFDDKKRMFRSNVATGFYVNYRITLEVNPSRALLEAMVRYSISDDKFDIVGDVNRINKYGNQSKCIKSSLLEKYCYCI